MLVQKVQPYWTVYHAGLRLAAFLTLMAGAVATAPGQDAGKDAYVGSAKKEAGDYQSLEQVPPVKYIKPQFKPAEIPQARGQYREVLEPDTLDLAERARLFIDNYLCAVTMPNLGYEPFDRGSFEQAPPRIFLSTGAYQCALPKYREALPLLRLMCGSRQGLEIDKGWGDNILKCIGPDGLYYIPLNGRPWEWAGAYDWVKKLKAEFYTNLWTCNGRLLGALAIYYKMTGDETWKKTGERLVDRLNELAIKVDGEAFFPKFMWMPGEKLTDKEIQEAIKTRHDTSASESGKNTPLWQTWIITGLAQFYRETHYAPAKELAVGLVNYMNKANYVEKWGSHFHCISLGMHALVELAEATGEMKYAEQARQAYDTARSGKRSVAFPEIGFFINFQGGSDAVMEGCTIADMTAIAIKLARLGLGDQYWEDIDRYVRNSLTESQFTRPDQIRAFTDNLAATDKAKPTPVLYNHKVNGYPECMVGAWQLHSTFNNMFAVGYWDPCCTGNCTRAIYYVWKDMLERDKDGNLVVRLLLNRASPWADVESYIPYVGRVDLKIKQDCKAVKVRMNDWIEREKVTCTVDGRTRAFKWDGSYLVLGGVKAGQTVKLEFPIGERTKDMESFGFKFRAVFRGNECVDLTPRGPDYPMYQRGFYRTNQPRFIKVNRFTCENTITH